ERNSRPLNEVIYALPTLRATDGSNGGPNQRGRRGDLALPSMVHRLPTPTASDAKASGAAGDSTQSGRHSGTTLTDVVAGAAPAGRAGRLNPRFCEWMMDLPIGWTDSECSATESYLQWQQQHS